MVKTFSFAKNRRVAKQLGEDLLTHGNYACPGCTAELALRFALKILGKKTVVHTTSSCGTLMACGMGDEHQTKCSASRGLMNDVPAIMTGAKRYYERIGKEATVMAFLGDGATADVGFQALSGAAERGENLLHICYDNEGYMNTGIQRSATTPHLSWTNTSPVGSSRRGKKERAKNMPLIMAFHGVPYVATASPAHLEDFAAKLNKAQAIKHGMAYIHLLIPCVTGWRAPSDMGIELAKRAVQTNYFPLWEAEDGRFQFTVTPKKIKPISDFIEMIGRFKHMSDNEIEDFQQYVNDRYKTIEYFTKANFNLTP